LARREWRGGFVLVGFEQAGAGASCWSGRAEAREQEGEAEIDGVDCQGMGRL
jgi:hypothetical protein